MRVPKCVVRVNCLLFPSPSDGQEDRELHKRFGVRSALGALALGMVLAAAGCRPPEPEYEGTFVTLVSADAALAERVAEALAAEGVPMAGVEISVANGVVALAGRVPSDADRRAAEETARVLADVQGVRNELAVGPAPAAAQRAPASPPALASR